MNTACNGACSHYYSLLCLAVNTYHKSTFGWHDTQLNDTQLNDTEHYDTERNDTQHNKKNSTLTIRTFNIMVLNIMVGYCYCAICTNYCMLNVINKPFSLSFFMLHVVMLSVVAPTKGAS